MGYKVSIEHLTVHREQDKHRGTATEKDLENARRRLQWFYDRRPHNEWRTVTRKSGTGSPRKASGLVSAVGASAYAAAVTDCKSWCWDNCASSHMVGNMNDVKATDVR